jgi:hypothetical protein
MSIDVVILVLILAYHILQSLCSKTLILHLFTHIV